MQISKTLIKDGFESFWNDCGRTLHKPEATEDEIQQVKETIEIIYNNGAISMHALLAHYGSNTKVVSSINNEVKELLESQ
jgi:hypothetical protein